MRCKACDAPLYSHSDDTYCRKCIVASEDTDVYNGTTYQDSHIQYNHELRVQLFLSEYERKELLKDK